MRLGDFKFRFKVVRSLPKPKLWKSVRRNGGKNHRWVKRPRNEEVKGLDELTVQMLTPPRMMRLGWK